jgi:hypothetical protein
MEEQSYAPVAAETATQTPPGGQQNHAAARAGAPAYLTARDVADLLKLDDKTIFRWAKEDASMPVLKRGRERLLGWLQRQERRAPRTTAGVTAV